MPFLTRTLDKTDISIIQVAAGASLIASPFLLFSMNVISRGNTQRDIVCYSRNYLPVGISILFIVSLLSFVFDSYFENIIFSIFPAAFMFGLAGVLSSSGISVLMTRGLGNSVSMFVAFSACVTNCFKIIFLKLSLSLYAVPLGSLAVLLCLFLFKINPIKPFQKERRVKLSTNLAQEFFTIAFTRFSGVFAAWWVLVGSKVAGFPSEELAYMGIWLSILMPVAYLVERTLYEQLFIQYQNSNSEKIFPKINGYILIFSAIVCFLGLVITVYLMPFFQNIVAVLLSESWADSTEFGILATVYAAVLSAFGTNFQAVLDFRGAASKMVKFDLLFVLVIFSIPFLCKAAEMSLYMTFFATIVSCVIFNIIKMYVQTNEFKTE